MYIDEISNKISMQPRLVSYHIDLLEKKKFVVTRYEIKQGNSKRAIVIKLCEINPHSIEVLKDIRDFINTMIG
jgi:DNA-binding transcriptional ArsR family regulator